MSDEKSVKSPHGEYGSSSHDGRSSPSSYAICCGRTDDVGAGAWAPSAFESCERHELRAPRTVSSTSEGPAADTAYDPCNASNESLESLNRTSKRSHGQSNTQMRLGALGHPFSAIIDTNTRHRDALKNTYSPRDGRLLHNNVCDSEVERSIRSMLPAAAESTHRKMAATSWALRPWNAVVGDMQRWTSRAGVPAAYRLDRPFPDNRQPRHG
jgi:hypothetical protein